MKFDYMVLKCGGTTRRHSFESIQLVKTKGKHGRGEILNYVGNVCGIVFKHSTEKTLYFTGDTVWYEAVKQTIDQYNPEIIVANAGDNHF